jgi:hypothetical protein
MKVLLLFIFFSHCAVAQFITGNVYDVDANEPMVGVSVYFDGTTLSTTTNQEGFFSIKVQQGLNKPLIFSYIGYEKVVLDDPDSVKARLKVMMKTSTEVLDQVFIERKTIFSRKQMLKAFRKQFLGENKGGKSCTIENEDDIYLYYDTGTNTLHAEAKKPIRIINKYLQYDVNFDLADFQVAYYSTSLDENELASTFYAGTTFFKDTSKSGSAHKKRWQAYRGCATHLMRTIYTNDWEKQEFKMYVDKIPIPADSCFAVTDSLAYKKVTLKELPPMEVPGMILADGVRLKRDYAKTQYVIMYKGSVQSVLNFRQRHFYVGAQGLFSPISAILFGGYMGDMRAGDLLPDDYEYTETD